jgi:thioredoxin
MIDKLTTEEFKKTIYDIDNTENADELKFLGNKPTLIDFYADWCGPCKMLEPILEELAEEYEDKINIFKVDVEKEMQLAVTFGAMSLPTLLFIPESDRPTLSPGAPGKQLLVEMIEQKLLDNKKNTATDERLDTAVKTFNSLMDKIKEVLK